MTYSAALKEALDLAGLSSSSELEVSSPEERNALDLTFCCCFFDSFGSFGSFGFLGLRSFGSLGFRCLLKGIHRKY